MKAYFVHFIFFLIFLRVTYSIKSKEEILAFEFECQRENTDLNYFVLVPILFKSHSSVSLFSMHMKVYMKLLFKYGWACYLRCLGRYMGEKYCSLDSFWKYSSGNMRIEHMVWSVVFNFDLTDWSFSVSIKVQNVQDDIEYFFDVLSSDQKFLHLKFWSS